MKKITLSIFLLVFSIGFSQNAPINFEAGGFGEDWTWTTFENPSTPAPPLEIIANPDPSGINTSATVAKLTPLVGSPPYAGVETAFNNGIGTFTLNTTNCTIKIMVWKSVISDVGIKFAVYSPGGGASTGEIKVANTLVNQWEELTFNFAGKIGEPSSTGINQIVVFPDFQTRTTDNICYFDNITFSEQLATPTGPTVAAATPTRPAENVISMFSNAYTNVPVNTWKTDWSPGVTLEDLQVAGNDTKKYTNLQFVGVETIGANLINAGDMVYFHVDYWTPNMTTFRVKLVDVGANADFGGGDDTESELIFTPTIAGWNSLEIPLSDFTTLINKDHIAQLIFSGNPSGTAVVYIDNVYFHNFAVVVPQSPTAAAPTPTLPAENVISMFSHPYTNVAVNTWKTDWSPGVTLEDLQIEGNDTKKYTNLQFVGVETVGANLIDASEMLYFHVDYWTPNMTTFRVKLVDVGANADFGGGDDTESELIFTPTIAGWNSLEIPLSDFTALIGKEHIAQLIFSGNPSGTAVVYVDNVYFHNFVVSNPNTPTVAAPTPTRPSTSVISMFSNAYTNVPVNTWKTDWSPGVVLEDLQIAGDDTKKYTNLDFVGIETVGANTIDASQMLYFHIDVWTPNMTAFRVKLVDVGANGNFGGGDDTEHEVAFTPTQSGWNSYDIPMTDFVNLAATSHIAQLILSGNPTGTGIVFIDNVYFSSVGLNVNNFETAKIKMYPNPVASQLTIEGNAIIQNISIYNVLGQEVTSKKPNTTVTVLDISEFQNGIYIVKTTIDGKTITSKVVKK